MRKPALKNQFRLKRRSNFQENHLHDKYEEENIEDYQNRRNLINLRQNPQVLKNYMGNERYIQQVRKKNFRTLIADNQS